MTSDLFRGPKKLVHLSRDKVAVADNVLELFRQGVVIRLSASIDFGEQSSMLVIERLKALIGREDAAGHVVAQVDVLPFPSFELAHRVNHLATECLCGSLLGVQSGKEGQDAPLD